MKGVPLRLELGPKDLEQSQCVLVRRDTGEKKFVSLDGLEASAKDLLEEIQANLFEKARRNLDEHTFEACSIEEVRAIMENGGGFAKTMWCGDEACEIRMKEEAGVTSRCIPFKQEHLGDTCPVCGKPAKSMIYWGVAY
jgi:prolyl-tRNA synthetase